MLSVLIYRPDLPTDLPAVLLVSTINVGATGLLARKYSSQLSPMSSTA